MLDRNVLKKITQIFGKPEIDLFASRVNNRVELYYSWRANPNAEAIDAFKQSWNKTLNYLFPPFSVIALALQKISHEETEAILVAPVWHTQSGVPCWSIVHCYCPWDQTLWVFQIKQLFIHWQTSSWLCSEYQGKLARARMFKRGYPDHTALMEK